jgi:hypothetical protein
MESTQKIKKGQIEDFLSDSTIDEFERLTNLLESTELKENKVEVIIESGATENFTSNTKYPTINALYNWCIGKFQNFLTGIENFGGIIYSVNLENINRRTIFQNNNPVTLSIPTQATLFFPIGTKKEITQQGNGNVTIVGSGIIFVTNLSLVMVRGETRQLTKIADNTWTIEGNIDRNNATFTGTTTLPSTTSIGDITSTIISFLSGITSNVQTQLNSKQSVFAGTTNFIPKSQTATSLIISRLLDNGFFFGFGTTNAPTKQITLGNQSNQEIGIEESNSSLNGKDLILSAGRTINYNINIQFSEVVTAKKNYTSFIGLINNDVLACDRSNNLFRQTNGNGEFSIISATNISYRSLALGSNNLDVFVSSNEGQLFKQTNGIGQFVSENLVNLISFTNIEVAPNGDIYGIVGWYDNGQSGFVYKRLASGGEFTVMNVALGIYNGLSISKNGNVYVSQWGVGILRMLHGTTTFNTFLSINNSGSVVVLPNGNIYHFTMYNSTDILISINQSSTFNIAPFKSERLSYPTCVRALPNGNVYIVGRFGEYFQMQDNQTLGLPNLDGGKLTVSSGTGKGNGKSRYVISTGQKTTSGTNMQIETPRIEVDEDGETTFFKYANNATKGQLPSNRIASFDNTGKLCSYTIATAPAPWINELVPDSYLPNTTGNIRIRGDFFTPIMADRVNNPNAIIIGGVTTIHYAEFVSSQEILVNVTTGNLEGRFSCTLNNGLSTTKEGALLIVLGTVYTPELGDWIQVVSPIDILAKGEAKLSVWNTEQSAVWNKNFDNTKNWRVQFRVKKSPLGNPILTDEYLNKNIQLIRASNGIVLVSASVYASRYGNTSVFGEPKFERVADWDKGEFYITANLQDEVAFWEQASLAILFEFRFVNNILYGFTNNILRFRYDATVSEPLRLKIKIRYQDIVGIKYIETA